MTLGVSLERLELSQLAGSKALVEALDESLEIPYTFRAIGMDDEECFDGAASSLLREIPHEDHDLAVGIERIIHRERVNLESNGVLQASGFREWTDRKPSENVVGLFDEFLRPLHDGRDNVSIGGSAETSDTAMPPDVGAPVSVFATRRVAAVAPRGCA